MVLADAVHVDPTTGKRTILGLFGGVTSTVLPITIPSMSVYGAISECRGIVPLTLRLVKVGEDDEPLFTFDIEANVADPVEVFEFHFTLTSVVLAEPGVYAFQLTSAGVPLMERKIRSIYIQKQGNEQPEA
jgi:hypothetical protein